MLRKRNRTLRRTFAKLLLQTRGRMDSLDRCEALRSGVFQSAAAAAEAAGDCRRRARRIGYAEAGGLASGEARAQCFTPVLSEQQRAALLWMPGVRHFWATSAWASFSKDGIALNAQSSACRPPSSREHSRQLRSSSLGHFQDSPL